MSHRRERFWRRFRGLSEEIKRDIRAALPKTETIERGDILLIELSEQADLRRLYALLEKLSLGPVHCEIIMSVVTSSDNGGIDVPRYILELIRRTDCGIGFSFVCTGTDEEVEDHPEGRPVTLH